MTKYDVTTDEMFPVLAWSKTGDVNGLEVPEKLMDDLVWAHEGLRAAERAVVDHLLDTGQWSRAYTHPEFLED